ncbi:MAG: hypothetical protein AAFQ94_14135 [Bacteroidota bacterium]
MRYLLVLIGICLLAFCQQRLEKLDLVEYQNGRQVLNMNDRAKDGKKLVLPTVEINAPDTIKVNEKFNAEIYLSDSNYQLVAAYFDCELVDHPTVDTVVYTANDTKRLDGCRKGLMVKNDTILIQFYPSRSGQRTFSEITILTLDNDRIFRTQNYSFNFYVAK